MVKEILDQLRARIAFVKEKTAKREQEISEKAERIKLNKELLGAQYKNVTKKPFFTFLKNTGSVIGKIGDNVQVNQERQKLKNIDVGTKVKITNGYFSDLEMNVTRFIPGGIEGKIKGIVVKIRHGSYRKV